MADKTRNYNEDLANIMDGLAEFTLEMTDEEIEAEIKEEGNDPDAVANRARDVLRTAIKSRQQRPLIEAQKRYEENVAALGAKEFRMPDLLEERREMINALLTTNPQFGSGLLTSQFRDFKNLPDEEVEGYLRQLLELIEINDLIDSEKGKQ